MWPICGSESSDDSNDEIFEPPAWAMMGSPRRFRRNMPAMLPMSDSESNDDSNDEIFEPPPWMLGSPRHSGRQANQLRPQRSGGMFDDLHLADRPRSWRPDFNARSSESPRTVPGVSRLAAVANRLPCFRRWQNTQSGMSLSLVSLIRSSLIRSFLYSESDRPDVTLSSHVAYSNPIAFTYDLRYPPNHSTKGHTLRWGLRNTRVNYAEMAATPAVRKLRMYHPSLPWYIDIEARYSYNITVGDVYEQMYESLRKPVAREEFYSNQLDAEDRKAILEAFKARCGESQRKRNEGMMRIDFMKLDVMFLGLEKGADGMWLMKTETIASEWSF